MSDIIDIIREQVKGDAVIYARYSTRMQNETSIEGQFRMAEIFAEKNGINVIGKYADRAMTGQNDKRPEFRRMIDDISDGEINVKYIIVYKLDRIARNADMHIDYEKRLNNCGVTILSATEPVNDMSKLSDRLMKSIIVLMNEEEIRKISENVIRGKIEAAHKGEWCGGTPPLGYDFDRNKKKLVINKDEAKIVKYAFKLRAEGFTYSYIIGKLNSKGYKTKLGNDFGKNSLYEIFRNIKYKGVYEYNKTVSKSKNGKINRHASKSDDEIIRIEGGCPQIVDEETWNKVNAMCHKKSGIKPKGNYLLSGLVVCQCGKVMQVNRRNNHNKDYYSFFCPAHKNKSGCDAKEINMLDLEDFVINQLANRIFDKSHIQNFIDNFSKFNEKNIKSSKKMINGCKREIIQNNQKIFNCVIIESKTLFELLNAINDFCTDSFMRDDDSECMELKEKVGNTNNEYLVLLSSYLCACEDGDEVIEALYEFIANCEGFAEADEEMTQQVTREEFETILDECEDKCGLRTCIESEHTLNLAEVNAVNRYDELNFRLRNNYVNLFLPRIDINTDKRQFISEQLGLMLYDVIKTKIPPEEIKQEISKYILEARTADKTARQFFKEYFYNVVQYQERKPGIYTEFDEHMKRLIVLEFFKRIIVRYLRE